MPPGVAAFGAAEEADLALISRPEMAEPPDRKVVFALRAFYLDCRHCFCLPLLLDDHDIVLAALHRALHLVSALDLPDIPAFPAL